MNIATRKRSYRMTARAQTAQATADRILDAATAVFWERPTSQVSLEEVARRAGVTKQTVLRRFGSKAGLLAAAAEREFERVELERDDVAPGDVARAARVLVSHYERIGDAVLRLIAEETRDPALRVFADRGRAYHARWCQDTFAPTLASLDGAERRRRLAELVAVTDVAVWRLLRDRLSRGQTETALRELMAPLVEGRR
jgi:AcrR family transcriptional regulator